MFGYPFFITVIVYFIVLSILLSSKPQLLYTIDGKPKDFDVNQTLNTSIITVDLLLGGIIFGTYIACIILLVLFSILKTKTL